ncbi:MAG: hypothetical protein VYE10_02870 [Candidatus Thermoplasmatota archaeon]|nr:hypothetical protein [Candidatus Thermoplasmatota archaeon]
MAIDIISILFPAVFAGLVAIISTVFVERGGGAIGGIITLPTTIVPASLGIWSEVGSEESFSAAMSIVPVGMLLNLLFLGIWRNSPMWFGGLLKGNTLLAAVSVLSVALWAIFAGISASIVEMTSNSIDPLMIAITTTSASIVLGFVAVKSNPTAPAGKNAVGWGVLLVRGTAAGLAIGASVWIASMGLPFISGIISVFPAIFLTTMVSLWLSQGPEVPIGAAGPMMLGSASVSIYAILTIFLFPVMSPWMGAIISWFIVIGTFTAPVGYWTWRTLDGGEVQVGNG